MYCSNQQPGTWRCTGHLMGAGSCSTSSCPFREPVCCPIPLGMRPGAGWDPRLPWAGECWPWETGAQEQGSSHTVS